MTLSSLVKVHYIECSVTTFITLKVLAQQGESMRKTVQWPPALYQSCQDAIHGVAGALKHVCGYNKTSNLFPVHAGSDALGLCVSTSGNNVYLRTYWIHIKEPHRYS